MRLLTFPLVVSCLALLTGAAPVAWDTSSDLSVRDLWPRAPAPGYAVLELELDGQRFKVQKNGDQGIHGVVYRVVEGEYKGAFAKAMVEEDEIKATHAVGAMYMWGLDPHHQRWMLVKPAPGTRLDKTAAYRRVQHSPQHCWALVNHAIDLATASILSTYESSHYLHQDPVLGNVLFDDNVSRAHLIDWGCATTDSRQATPADVKGLVSHFFQNSRGVQLCGGGPPPQVVHIPVMHAPANHCPMPVYHLGHALPGWH